MVLARPAREINLRQLLEHFEKHLFVSGCENIEDDCPLHQDCPICFQWEHLKTIMNLELERINFEDLANNAGSIKKLNFIGLVPKNLLGMAEQIVYRS